MTIKKETGPEREFDSRAKRQAAAGKGTPVLFPGDAYLDICKHFEDGAVHYGGRNWEKGLPLSSYIDSLERHIAQEKMGLTDESHDRAIAWNAICYLATKLRIQAGILPKELDDLCGVYGDESVVKEDPMKDVAYPICPLNVYFEGDEDVCNVKNCDFGLGSRGCHSGCQVKDEFAGYTIAENSEWGWYVNVSSSSNFLHKDLKIHDGTCEIPDFSPYGEAAGYYPTKEIAEAYLRAYLGNQDEYRFAEYCKECRKKLQEAKSFETVLLCEKCVKIL